MSDNNVEANTEPEVESNQEQKPLEETTDKNQDNQENPQNSDQPSNAVNDYETKQPEDYEDSSNKPEENQAEGNKDANNEDEKIKDINQEQETENRQENNQEEEKKTEINIEERPSQQNAESTDKKEASHKKEKKREKEERREDQEEGEVLRPGEDGDDDDEDDERDAYDDEDYGDMDKLEIPKFEKDKGLECFKKGNFEEATKHFSKAILGVNFLFKDEMVQTEEKAVELLKNIQIPCYLNNALCFIKLKTWKMAFENASAVLKLDEDNVKGLYRRGVASFNLGDLEGAREDLKRALEFEPNNTEIRGLIEEINAKRRQLKEKEKKMNQQMLEELSKAREEEQKEKNPKKRATSSDPKSSGKVAGLKDKVMEPFITGKKEVTKKVKTWRDQLKLLILLPLSLMSEICCRRRLPAQFYGLSEDDKKNN